ncbi:MAG: radical SAM protein [Chloroflexi bacterium]|nr:radical SAM protein [Chloroflexota bacterium]
MSKSPLAGIQSLISNLHSAVGGRHSPLIIPVRDATRHPPPATRHSPLVPPGLHHYTRQTASYRSRIHLRIDPDGHGTLIVNANRVMHFNPTAAMMAYLILEETPEPQAVRAVTRGYRVSKTQAQSDYTQFLADFDEIIRPDGCPACNLDDLEIAAPFSARPTAPYRMDLALTYRCNNDCAHCYNARPRDYPEMPTARWKRVIDRAWDLSIPHIIFTGGEPTLRDDLPELVAHAEANGQITGLNTNARRLSDGRFLDALVEAGLDHVQITVESHDAQIHDQMVGKSGAWKQTIAGLRNVLDSPLYVMTNTTMLQDNYSTLGETLDFLAEEGVPTLGLNALIYSGRGLTVGTGLRESELPALLELAREKTAAHNQRLIWYTPTQYCKFDPMQLELGVKGCTAALYNMCVEPDGGVIPCQSYYQQLGNILQDPWDSIWNHELAVSLRERKYVPDECHECDMLPECGGGCPLAMEAHGLGVRG